MIVELAGIRPTIAEDVYLAPTAVIIGNVTILPGANIWFGAVLRGDSGRIVIGRRVSVQDNVVVHVNERADTIIGDDVLIGHGAILEGCRIGAGALVGMGATVLSGAHIGVRGRSSRRAAWSARTARSRPRCWPPASRPRCAGPWARTGGTPGARPTPLPGDGAALYARRPGDRIKKSRPRLEDGSLWRGRSGYQPADPDCPRRHAGERDRRPAVISP